MRRRLPLPGVIAGMAVVIAALAAGAVWANVGRPSTRLAGAELIADRDGPARPIRQSFDDADPSVALDNLWLRDMRVVSAGDDEVVLLVRDGFGHVLVRASRTGEILDARTFPMNSHTGAFDMAPDGRYVATLRKTVSKVAADWITAPEHLEARRAVGAVDVDSHGLPLVGGAAGPTIDALAPDGTTRRLLAPASDPGAEVAADKRLGPIVALQRLPDQRVVFVSDTAGGFRLHVIDRGLVRRIEGDDGRNPVRFTSRPSVGWDGTAGGIPADGPHLPVMTPLAPGPGGRVITIGLGREYAPEISLVDVDTGAIDVLARLEGVEPSDAAPVSAVAVGDDLVFTAAGCVWRLEGAFARLT
jgi:hypothetical protein